MALDHRLISQFAKLVTDTKKQSSETTVYGTVKTDANGNKYVQLDGSDQLTPLTEENRPSVDTATANTKEGDRVSVLIKNHTATVTGNISSPAANDGDIETAITKFDIAVGDQIQANKGYFKDLIADKADIGNLAAAIISVAELIAKDAKIEELVAAKATIDDLIAKKIDTDVVIADSAIIDKMQADSVDILSLIADKAVIEDLIANNADLNSVEARNAYLKYANIDFANIGEAAICALYAKTGTIQDLTFSDGHVTGKLVGVTIVGDLIEGGTVKADKLVVKGEDGLYYKLNMAAGATTSEVVSEEDLQNGLSGDVILAKTITAEKVNVNDLVAFGATIGRFHIKENTDADTGAIYSGAKSAVDSENPGLYMDSEGQAVFGNKDSFLKFYKDEDGNYKLLVNISAGMGFDEKGLTVETPDGKTKTRIGGDGVIVYTDDEEKPNLSADSTGVKATNLHATTYMIVGDNSRFENYGKNRTGCFWFGN